MSAFDALFYFTFYIYFYILFTFTNSCLAVTVAANADGGVVLTTTGNKNANLPAKNTTSVVIKKNSRATFKSIRNTVRANNFRKDQKVPPRPGAIFPF